MTLYRLFSLFAGLLCGAFLLTACAQPSGEKLLAYRETDAAFRLTFPALGGSGEEVVCGVTVTDGTASLTILSPQRSAGTKITCVPEGSTLLFSDGSCIPLSAEASAGIWRIFSVLYYETEIDLPSRSADGERTTIPCESGTLVLDEKLLPIAVTTDTAGGGQRTVRIEDYRLLPDGEA